MVLISCQNVVGSNPPGRLDFIPFLFPSVQKSGPLNEVHFYKVGEPFKRIGGTVEKNRSNKLYFDLGLNIFPVQRI